MAELARRCEVHPDQISAWKRLVEQAVRAFDPDVGIDAETVAQKQADDLCAKTGQLTVERDSPARRSGR